MDNPSLADIAAVTGNDGFGNGSWVWVILLFILMGNGFNRNDCATEGDVQRGFYQQTNEQMIRGVSNGLADLGYALDNSVAAVGGAVKDAQYDLGMSGLNTRYELGSKIDNCCCTTNRNIDQVRYDMSLGFCDVKQNDNANTQKILDLLYQNKIEALQGKVNQLELQSALCGVVRYPNQTTYTAGCNPFFNNGYAYGTAF